MAGENSHSWTEGPCFHLKYSWSRASMECSSLPSNATCASLLFSHFAKWLYLYLSPQSTHICPTPFTRFLPLADDLPDTLWRKQKLLEEFSHLPTNKPTNWPTSLSVFFLFRPVERGRVSLNPSFSVCSTTLLLQISFSSASSFFLSTGSQPWLLLF